MVMTNFTTRNVPNSSKTGDLSWNISCSDESEDEERLTALVRHSYIKHLKSCLRKNYEKWYKSNISFEELNFCSEMLEKKALRSCMVTSIYRRTMTRLVKEVKDATLNDSLYNGFSNKFNIVKNTRCDKKIQTDDNDEVLENKKETVMSNEELLINTNSNSSFINSKSLFLEAFGETEAEINLKLEQDGDGTDSYEELLNILLFSPKMPDNVKTKLETTNNEENVTNLCKKRKLINGGKFTCQNVTKEKTLDTDSQIATSLLVNWPYELYIQNIYLESILSRLKPHKRIIVERRFTDLFGKDNVMDQQETKLNEQEVNYYRKRIARIIVGELTRFYIDGKIGSRPLFKDLAKKLTDDVMCTSLTPDPENIRRTVRDLFIGGKQINSLKDVF